MFVAPAIFLLNSTGSRYACILPIRAILLHKDETSVAIDICINFTFMLCFIVFSFIILPVRYSPSIHHHLFMPLLYLRCQTLPLPALYNYTSSICIYRIPVCTSSYCSASCGLRHVLSLSSTDLLYLPCYYILPKLSCLWHACPCCLLPCHSLLLLL